MRTIITIITEDKAQVAQIIKLLTGEEIKVNVECLGAPAPSKSGPKKFKVHRRDV